MLFRLTSPSTLESNLVISKNLTAISPVTTPTLSVSACRNSCPYARFSSGVRLRLGAPGYASVSCCCCCCWLRPEMNASVHCRKPNTRQCQLKNMQRKVL